MAKESGVLCVRGGAFFQIWRNEPRFCARIGGCFASGPEYREKSGLEPAARAKWLGGEGRGERGGGVVIGTLKKPTVEIIEGLIALTCRHRVEALKQFEQQVEI